MPEDDRQHKKKLKEAQKVYDKNIKAFSQGKITKEELKNKLRPYKFELKELGYPVKIKDDEQPPGEAKEEVKAEVKEERKPVKITASYKPWSKRSSLTVDEIERNVDILSIGSSPSESLKSLYKSKYGEELPPPQDLIQFDRTEKQLPSTKPKAALPAAEDEEDGGEEETVAGEKRSFWKSLVKGKKAKEAEET